MEHGINLSIKLPTRWAGTPAAIPRRASTIPRPWRLRSCRTAAPCRETRERRLVGRRPDPAAGSQRAKTGCADSAAAQNVGHRSREPDFRESAGNFGHQSGQDGEHSRAQRRNHRHRRAQQQCELPQNLRSAAHRGISGGGRTLVFPGRQRRNCRDVDRCVAVGSLQPDWRIWAECDQGRKDRLSVWLRQFELAAGQPDFSKARASGLCVKDYQDAILVNNAGMRFYDETQGQYPANNYNSIKSYVPRSYLNAANVKYEPSNFINAALAGTGDSTPGGGPIWAFLIPTRRSVKAGR